MSRQDPGGPNPAGPNPAGPNPGAHVPAQWGASGGHGAWQQSGYGQQPAYGGQPYGQQPPGSGPPAYAGEQGPGARPTYGIPGGYGSQPGVPVGAPPGGWGPQPPLGSPPDGRPTKKSPALIIGIVAAAIVLLAAVGGIFIALSRGNNEPVATITPAPPSVPAQPSPSGGKSGAPSSPGQNPGHPAGAEIDLGNGVTLTPAAGWKVQDQAASVASLTNSQGVFYGRQLQQPKSTNPEQLCDSFNRAALESSSDAQFGQPAARNVGSSKLSVAVCSAAYTATSGDQSAEVYMSSMVSVRKSDGVTVIGTLLFVKATDEQTKTDAGAMMSSMLTSQAR